MLRLRNGSGKQDGMALTCKMLWSCTGKFQNRKNLIRARLRCECPSRRLPNALFRSSTTRILLQLPRYHLPLGLWRMCCWRTSVAKHELLVYYGERAFYCGVRGGRCFLFSKHDNRHRFASAASYVIVCRRCDAGAFCWGRNGGAR